MIPMCSLLKSYQTAIACGMEVWLYWRVSVTCVLKRSGSVHLDQFKNTTYNQMYRS